MNQATIQAIGAWAQQIKDTVVAVAPKVWQVALSVKRADSIGALITNGIEALLLGAFAVTCLVVAYRFFGVGQAKDKSEKTDNFGSVPGWAQYLVAAGCSLCGIVSGIFAFSTFAAVAFDQWVWIGATNPGLAVAHDLIQKALSQ